MRVLLVGLTLTAVTGCYQQNSELKHQVNAPVRSDSAHFFAKVNDHNKEYYFSRALSGDGLEKKHFVEASHPFAKRAQFWLDKLDEQIRSEDPKGLVGVPKPVAMVGMRQDLNANVKGHLKCYSGVDVLINAGSEAQQKFDKVVDYEEVFKSVSWCDNVEANEMDVLGAVKGQMIADEGLTCGDFSLTVNQENRLIAQAECVKEDGSKPSFKTIGAYIIKTSPYITIYSGLMTSVSEEVYLGVLAHELGHYYRSHTSLISSDKNYDYYYRVTGLEGDGRPTPLDKNAPEWADISKYEKALGESEKILRQTGDRQSPEYLAAMEEVKAAEKILSDARIGQYTAEQEADQLSAEWLHDLSVDPKTFSEFWANRRDDGSCKGKFDNDWKDDAGKLLTVGVGFLHDTHHNACFRAYSTDRDVVNHKFEAPKGGYQGLLGTAGYREMQAEFPYEDSLDLVKAFYPERSLVVDVTYEEFMKYGEVSFAKMKEIASGDALRALTNIDFSMNTSSCLDAVTAHSAGDTLGIFTSVQCDHKLRFATMPSTATANIEWTAKACNLGGFDGELLTDVLPLVGKGSCIDNTDLKEVRVQLGSVIELQDTKLQADYGHDLTYKVSSLGGGPVVVAKSGSVVSISDFEETYTGEKKIKRYSGTSYNETSIHPKGRSLRVSNLRNESGKVFGSAKFEMGKYEGEFEIVDGEMQSLRTNVK